MRWKSSPVGASSRPGVGLVSGGQDASVPSSQRRRRALASSSRCGRRGDVVLARNRKGATHQVARPASAEDGPESQGSRREPVLAPRGRMRLQPRPSRSNLLLLGWHPVRATSNGALRPRRPRGQWIRLRRAKEILPSVLCANASSQRGAEAVGAHQSQCAAHPRLCAAHPRLSAAHLRLRVPLVQGRSTGPPESQPETPGQRQAACHAHNH